MFIPLACVSRLSFFSVSLVQLSFFVYVFVSLYIYISSFDLILAHPICISSVLLSLTYFRFELCLPIMFCQCLIITSLIRLISTYSRVFCIPFSIACLSSFLCFHFIIFLFFSLNHFFFSIFFSVFVYLVYLPAYCLSLLTRRLPLIVRVKQIYDINDSTSLILPLCNVRNIMCV